MKKMYYTEQELIEKAQKGEIDELFFVTHFSKEWDEEYAVFLKERGLEENNASAAAFMEYRDRLLEESMEGENA